MTVFHLTKERIEKLPEPNFGQLGILERCDLQRLLKANFKIIAPDVLIIAEEFSEWEDSKRRIDLLGIDHNANLVVIELKRDNDGSHMDLQALRYAAMASTMTFDKAVEVFRVFLKDSNGDVTAREALLDFLGWDAPREEDFARETRVILVAADFQKEITTTVLWLNDVGLDIRCVRLKPYQHGGEIFVHIAQIVPLPEAQDYQIRLREKVRESRESARQPQAPPGFWFMNVGDAVADNRSWDDRKGHGFMSLGGGTRIEALKKLRPDEIIFAYATEAGYVGVERVISSAVPWTKFRVPGGKSLVDLPLITPSTPQQISESDGEWVVGVNWLRAVKRDEGRLRWASQRGTLCQFRNRKTVEDILRAFDLDWAIIERA